MSPARHSRDVFPEDRAVMAGEGERVILIVEDEPLLRASMARGLSRLSNLEIVVAGNVAEGRKLIGALRPHVLVLDLHLPDGSGLELLSEIDRHRLSAATIFVTAYPQKLHGQLPARSDVRVLEKPVPIAQLRDTVLDVFDGMGVRSSSPSPFSLADYLQLAGYARRTVQLEVCRDGERLGSVWVKDGFGYHADDTSGEGLAAFRRLLQAPDVTIECRVFTAHSELPRTLDQSCEELLLTSTRIFDEERRAGEPEVSKTESAPPSELAGWDDLDIEPIEPVALTSRSAGVLAPPQETFERLYERGVEALLSRSYDEAYAAFVAAGKLGTTAGLEANLTRLRAMGHGR